MENNRKQIPQRMLGVISAVLKSEGYELADLINKDDCSSKELLSLRETAKYLGLSVDTIKRRLRDGSFKGKKLHASSNGSVRVLWSSVLDWLAEHDLKYSKKEV